MPSGFRKAFTGNRSMKHIVIVRHGQYESGGRLSDSGKRTIAALARVLKEKAAPPVRIISSVALRATETADIIAKELGAQVEQTRLLYSDSETELKLAEIQALMTGSTDVETVIAVTHYEYGCTLHRHFAETLWSAAAPSENLEKGQAWFIEMDTRRITKLKA